MIAQCRNRLSQVTSIDSNWRWPPFAEVGTDEPCAAGDDRSRGSPSLPVPADRGTGARPKNSNFAVVRILAHEVISFSRLLRRLQTNLFNPFRGLH